MKKLLRLVFVLVLTVVLLYFFLRNANAHAVGAQLKQTVVFWVLAGCLCNVLALVCRAERWRTIVDPASPPPFYPTFFSTSIGFMASALLPVRAGDVVRPALLSRRTDVRFSRALGTVLTERVLDLLAVLLLFGSFVLTTGRRLAAGSSTKSFIIHTAGITAAILFVAMTSLIVSVFFFGDRVRVMHEFIGRIVPQRFREAWMHFYDSFVGSIALLGRGKVLVRLVLLTAAIWLCLSSQFYFVMFAMRHPLPYNSSFFVTGMTIVGLMFPTPGGVGGFHKACQIALTNFYGIPVSASVAIALVFHIVGTAPTLLTGAVLLLREHVSLRQVARIGENLEE